jgi:hypothetical protein
MVPEVTYKDELQKVERTWRITRRVQTMEPPSHPPNKGRMAYRLRSRR